MGRSSKIRISNHYHSSSRRHHNHREHKEANGYHSRYPDERLTKNERKRKRAPEELFVASRKRRSSERDRRTHSYKLRSSNSKYRSKRRRLETSSDDRRSSSDSSFYSGRGGPRADADNHLVYRTGDCLIPRYQILSTVGEGTFGKVVLCSDKNNKNSKVAVKIIKRVAKYYRSAKIEIRILEKILEKDPGLKHRCVRLLDHFDYEGFMCLSFEWLGISVFDFLKENSYFPYPMEQIKAISYQLIDSVAFLHKNGITHTDLKPENILFVNSDYEITYNSRFDRDERIIRNPEIRLIDFGSATCEDDSHSTVVSTRHYRAFEVILEIGWDEKCDVWSVGGIMFELFTGNTLFQTHDNWEHLAMMKYILGDFPPDMVAKTDKRKYFYRGDLDWNYEEDNSTNCRIKSMCRPLRECFANLADKNQKHLFDLLYKELLVYEPRKRAAMRKCLEHAFFDTVRSVYKVS